MAFSVWRIEEDCLPRAPSLRIDYKGPDPFGVVYRVLEVARDVLGVRESDVWEAEFAWDNSAVPYSFTVRAYASKPFDKKTQMVVEFVFNGKQPADPKESGILTIEISSKLVTAYPLKGIFQQSFWYRKALKVYHETFYASERARFLSACTELTKKIVDEVRKLI